MSLITSRTVLSDRAAVGASARKIVNERAVQGAEAARESENTLSDLQATATQRIQKAVERRSTLKNDTLRNGIVTSRTTLKSLKYSDFNQSTGQPSIPSSDLRPFKNTGASIGQDMTPDTKVGLGLEAERRKQDAVRLGKTMDPGSSPSAQRFLINQTLVNQSVALNQALKGNLKEATVSAIVGAARVAGVAASAIAQAAGSGTGLRVVQGFVPLNGGYVTTGNLLDTLNPFNRGDNQISKASIALRGKTINDGFIQTGFEEAISFTKDQQNTTITLGGKPVTLNRTDRPTGANLFTKDTTGTNPGRYLQALSNTAATKRSSGTVVDTSDISFVSNLISKADSPSKKSSNGSTIVNLLGSTSDNTVEELAKKVVKDAYVETLTDPSAVSEKGPGNFVSQTTAVAKVKRKGTTAAGDKSLESRFFVSGKTSGQDKINILNVKTTELLNDPSDIIPFTIQNIPATGNTEFLYFRAYLDSMSDSYSGEWSGTRYIGRAEELYNYTGFKRGLQFSFKIAAHSPQELKPLYEKLNRLAGTTAPTYQNGLFMQGVFSKITIGDYVQKLPGFFTSVDLAWQTTYPWEIGNVNNGARDNDTPRVPHILDVSVSFQPVHDFAPQYGQNFIVNTAAS